MAGRPRSANPQARREYVDSVTGARTRTAAPGARRSGRLVARVRPRKGEPFEVVVVDPEDLDPSRDTFGVDADADATLRASARAQASSREPKPMTRDAELDLGRAGATTTFASGRAAADAFMRNNPAIFDSPLFESADLIDATRDFMDRIEVRSGNRFVRLAKTPRGEEILSGAGRGHVSVAREMLVYLFGQAGRSRRWRDVPWGLVDAYVDEVTRTMQEEAKRQGRTAPAGGIEWYPLSSGVYQPDEVVAMAVDELGEAKARKLAAWLNSQSLFELADRLEAVLKPPKGSAGKAARRAKKCLNVADRKTVRRRIREIRQWAAYPDLVPTWACVATRETESTAVPVCHYPAVEAEIDHLFAACDAGYDPNWPQREHARLCAQGDTDTSGLPPQPCPEDEFAAEDARIDDELLDVPWENPKRNPSRDRPIATRKTAQDTIIHLWPDGSLTWALGRYIEGSPQARTPAQIEKAIAAGWLVLGEVELYDDEEIPSLIKAARWAAERGSSPGEMRKRLHERKPMKPVWTVIETDRDGKPRVRVWKLPRLGWPGLSVWSEGGTYSVWSEIGRSGSYAPTGMEFTNLRDLTKYLDETRSDRKRNPAPRADALARRVGNL